MKKTLFAAALLVVGAAVNAQSFTDGFEGAVFGGAPNAAGNTPGGDDVTSVVTWRALNASVPLGVTGWFANNTVFPAHTGTGLVNANFNNTTGTNTINNYLMSPVRTFTAGDTISFWTRTVDSPFFPDRLILKLSTNGASTNVADFTQTLLTVNAGLSTTGYPNVWTQFTTTLTSGGTGRFAFNYNVTNGGPSGANSDFIGIDDVQYTAVPEPATMAALGLGVAALLRRRRK